MPGHSHAIPAHCTLHIAFSFTECTHLMMCDPQPFPQLSRKVCCALDTDTRQTFPGQQPTTTNNNHQQPPTTSNNQQQPPTQPTNQPNQTKPNQTKPNQTKPNQTKPTNNQQPTTNNHNNNNYTIWRGSVFNRRGASTRLWGVEACSLPSRRPNRIPAIPPYVVRTPYLRGAPTTEETVKL